MGTDIMITKGIKGKAQTWQDIKVGMLVTNPVRNKVQGKLIYGTVQDFDGNMCLIAWEQKYAGKDLDSWNETKNLIPVASYRNPPRWLLLKIKLMAASRWLKKYFWV